MAVKLKEITNDSAAKIAEGAIKYDGGKTPIFQGALDYFPRAIEAVAAVSAFGASKYAWKGWEKMDDPNNRVLNALFRHQFKIVKGEEYDEESKLLHAAHRAWNDLADLELILRKKEQEPGG